MNAEPVIRFRRRALVSMSFGVLALGASQGAVADLPAATERITWDTNGVVRAIVDTGDSIILGGDFTYVGPRTGSAAFAHPTTLALNEAFPAFEDGVVHEVVSDGAGGYFVGGSFTRVGGRALAHLVRIRADGSVDESWLPAADGTVFALLLNDGVLYVGGEFQRIGGGERVGLAAIDAETALVTQWAPGNGGIEDLELIGATLFAAGHLTTSAGTRRGVAAVDTLSGDVLPFEPVACCVRTLAAIGTTLYVGGRFFPIGGDAPVSAAAYDVTTGARTGWAPGFEGGSVEQLVADGSTIYATGNFDRPRRWTAAVDSVTGDIRTAWQFTGPAGAIEVRDGVAFIATSGLTGGLSARSFVTAVDAATGTMEHARLSLEDSVKSLAFVGAHLVVGGSFSHAGGVERRALVELDADSGAATTWDAELDANVHALELAGDMLYVGGDFQSIGGIRRIGAAGIDLGTRQLTPFDPRLSCPTDYGSCRVVVNNLSAHGDRVYLAGGFTQVGELPRFSLAAVDVRGAALPFDAHVSAGAAVHDLVASSDAVYVAGAFDEIGGAPRRNLAALDPSSGSALAWAPDPSGEVRTIALHQGALYVGGSFGHIRGEFRPWLAALDLRSGDALTWRTDASTFVNRITAANGTVYVAAGSGFVAGAPSEGLYALDASTGAARTIAAAGISSAHAVGVTSEGDRVVFGTSGRRHVLAFDLTHEVAPPPADIPEPPPSGGGGGGGRLPDLVLSGAADPAVLQPGEGTVLRFSVRIANAEETWGATDLRLHLQLPDGLDLAGGRANRGPGCEGSRGIVCRLDFLSGNLVATVELFVRTSGAGRFVVNASATANEADKDPSTNVVDVVLEVATPASTPTSPSAPTARTRIGTSRRDVLRGTAARDRLDGRGGDDTLVGKGGADVLLGRSGDDRLVGDGGGDLLRGGSGRDRLAGGTGNDRLVGGTGSDRLVGGSGRDTLDGGAGNDIIDARDRHRDVIRCGRGRDVALVGRYDRADRMCEVVKRSDRPRSLAAAR